MIPRALVLGLAAAVGLLAGCGGPTDGRVSVTGTVTFDGQPLQEGMITFVGSNGVAAAQGRIQNGSYSLRPSANVEGIDPGDYRVIVQSWEVQPGALQDDGSFAEGKSRIPEKYIDPAKSGLTAQVAEGGGTHDFQLQSSP